MSEWKKTSCVLCYSNCGLEVTTEGSHILKVRGDKENPRSQGYICRKGANIAYFQNNPERLKFPLKRVGDRFERISWEQALDEITAKLKEIGGNMGLVRWPTWAAVARAAILRRLSGFAFCTAWDQRTTTALSPRN